MNSQEHRKTFFDASYERLNQALRDSSMCCCDECFTCYVRDAWEQYKLGDYAFKAPPVCTAYWNDWDWIKFTVLS
jgi:hypothetical protein